MLTLSVFYPNTPGTRFDLDYYLGQHIPLVKERLRPLGLTGVDIEAGLAGGAPDSPAPFAAIGRLHFDSPEAMQTALATHGPELMGDIPNFTDTIPLIQVGRAV